MNAQDHTTPTNLTPNEEALLKQGMKQDEQRAMQQGAPDTTREVQQGMKPIYPQWPTSKRGPTITPPPPGQRPFNGIRAEQVVEVGYNQVTGEPSTHDPLRAFPDEAKGPAGTDQQETAQDVMRRGKERL
ncbi:MAG: hypothetical protein NVS4B11_38100 [Ktedonobacteraceae bacterium]